MTDLYPEIEPHAQGMLEVACGDLVYWEVCGDPNGKPALAHRVEKDARTRLSPKAFDSSKLSV